MIVSGGPDFYSDEKYDVYHFTQLTKAEIIDIRVSTERK